MKTSILRFCRNSFCKALVCALLSNTMVAQNLIALPSAGKFVSAPLAGVPSTDELRALSYVKQNSQVIMVHLENPAQKRVTIRIFNSDKQVIYKQELGKPETFIGRYNLKELSNGEYTLVVQGAGYRYVKSFSLHTETSRVVKLLEENTAQTKQDAI